MLELRLCAVVLAFAAGLARAEDPPADSGKGTVATASEEIGPEDLPGKQRGDREKAEVKPPAEPKEGDPAAVRSWFDTPWWQWTTATGDWGGVRTKLEDHGISIAGSDTLVWSSVWSGGLANRASTRTLLDVNITFDTAKMTGDAWKGGSFYVDYNSTDDRGKLGDSGSYQATNSIEIGKNVDQISEAWYQQKFWGDTLRVKAGKVDANAEFAFLASLADFLSGPTVNSPNILSFPTYPNQATGLVAFVYPTKQWYIGAGVFDGATQDGFATGTRGPATFFSDTRSSSWFTIGETGLTCEDLGDLGTGRVAAGVWHHSGGFARFDGTEQFGATGAYAEAEQQLVRRGASDADKAKGWFAMWQASVADENVSACRAQVAVGTIAKGTFKGREDDTAGLYVSYCNMSQAVGSPTGRDETLFEGFYKVQLTPWVSIIPDIQYIMNPGGTGHVKNAWAGSFQFTISF